MQSSNFKNSPQIQHKRINFLLPEISSLWRSTTLSALPLLLPPPTPNDWIFRPSILSFRRPRSPPKTKRPNSSIDKTARETKRQQNMRCVRNTESPIYPSLPPERCCIQFYSPHPFTRFTHTRRQPFPNPLMPLYLWRKLFYTGCLFLPTPWTGSPPSPSSSSPLSNSSITI